MYGLRDAGTSFDRKVTSTLDDSGFKEVSFSPCLATNLLSLAEGQKEKGLVRVTRHGDDFASLGRGRANADFEVGPKKHLIVKNQGTLGPGPQARDRKYPRADSLQPNREVVFGRGREDRAGARPSARRGHGEAGRIEDAFQGSHGAGSAGNSH